METSHFCSVIRRADGDCTNGGVTSKSDNVLLVVDGDAPKKGIAIVDVTFLPGVNGDFCNGETGYQVSDKGTGRIWTFMQVLAAADVQ